MAKSDRMAEAEVTLRFAQYVLTLPHADGAVEVAIDSQCVRPQIFDITRFLKDEGWHMRNPLGRTDWAGTYERNGHRLTITCRHGHGDLVAKIGTKQVLAECKGGPLVRTTRGNAILAEVLGQALILGDDSDGTVLVVAVPKTEQFLRLAYEHRKRPLIQQAGIHVCLVAPNTGDVTWPDGCPFGDRG